MEMLRVTAQYVTLKVRGDDGAVGVRGFYAGAVVPVDRVDPESVQHHVEGDMAEVYNDAAAEPVVEEAASSEDAPADTEQPVRPATAAPKADWVAYAVAVRPDGVSEEDAAAAADGKTKADLIAEYGG